MRSKFQAVVLILAAVFCASPISGAPIDLGPSTVTVSGRRLIVQQRNPDGTLASPSPWAIRGSVWSPASRTTNTTKEDPNNVAVRRLEFGTWAESDIALLTQMQVNTVRLVIDPGADAAGMVLLDRLYDAGIMVVMNVDDGVNNLTRIQQVVPHYKNHPAILMWMLGSEWNINLYFDVATTVQEAATRTETAASLVKSLDPSHPVATSYGDIDIDADGKRLADTAHYVNHVCLHVDVWSLNVYRGNSMGTLYSQWAGISGKPMFFGEFGTDAFRSAGSTSAGSVDGTMQSDWDISLWDEVFGHVSANVPEATVLGGFVFEHNDEWWKVSPAGSQQAGGFAGEHPDGFFNEEFFGVFDIDRKARPLRDALAAAFDAAYQPAHAHSYRVISRGAEAEEYSSQFGTLWFFRDGAKIYSMTGGAGGGRGFHVAVFDPATAALQQPVQHFDTWATRDSGSAFCEINTLLDGVPTGMLLLIGVADEAGLTQFPPNGCQPLNNACLTGFLQRVAALGSQQIGQYCYRGSWAMAAVKGEGVARAEAVSSNSEVSARTTLAGPTRTLSITVNGDGVVRSVPAGVQCRTSCNASLPLNGDFTLYAVAAQGSQFSTWSGICTFVNPRCDVTMSAHRTVTGMFTPSAPTAFYTVTPCRLLDTRNPNGPYGGPALTSANVRTVQVSGACGVPSTAKAVSLNLTAVNPATAGWFTLYPAGALPPEVSTMNFRAGKTRANNAIFILSWEGRIEISHHSTGTTNFLIDLNGYFE